MDPGKSRQNFVPEDDTEVIARQLQASIRGEVRIDIISRLLYSTDASIYEWEPLGVIFPRDQDDLQAVVEICTRNRAPIIARGSGSSLAGQAIGPGWVLDCSRYLDKLIEINPEEQSAWVEPGLILNSLNRTAKKFGLQFGPDPASAERATLGGSIANNATGAHSILYGMAADHLLGVEAVLSDGSMASFSEIELEEAERRSRDGSGVEAVFYQAALDIQNQSGEAIRMNWPRTWRRASGYNLNYLLPWSPTSPPGWGISPENRQPYPPVGAGQINLAQLIAGSEGTLAVMRKLKVKLVPLPKFVVLAVMGFSGNVEACELVPKILETQPSAVELIPKNLIALAKASPAYASKTRILDPLINAYQSESGSKGVSLLVVEYSGSDLPLVEQKARDLVKNKPHILALEPNEQAQIWEIRKVGLGLFLSRAGDEKPWSFIEDLSVPVERLGEFVREFERIMQDYAVEGDNYGHASAGCLHIRPVINLKTITGIRQLRSLARDAVELTLSFGGAVSGEHGDGIARSEWNERMFGTEIIAAFRRIKNAADPDNIFNPGKIVAQNSGGVPQMDRRLRFGEDYRTQAWTSRLDFSSQAGLAGAIEQCNGAGVCRKLDGVMCPSFQATREEMHSTRGRANLLRAMISGKFPTGRIAEKAVMDALDLCLGCKACKAECPSGVDMAKLKVEFLHHHYNRRTFLTRSVRLQRSVRLPRDYLFGYIGVLAKYAHPFWMFANPFLRASVLSRLLRSSLRLSRERSLPQFARKPLGRLWRENNQTGTKDLQKDCSSRVLFLSDPFTEYFHPEVGLAALKVLEALGCDIQIIPVIGSGRTMISKGFLDSAKSHAGRLIDAISILDPGKSCPIVGVEPSETHSLVDEYFDLLPRDGRVEEISKRTFMIDEYLIRTTNCDDLDLNKMRVAISAQYNNNFQTNLNKQKTQVLLHGHCYQKSRSPHPDHAPVGAEATKLLLEKFGYQVDLIPAGCCGMAGAFGYEDNHVDISMQVGEIGLFPAVRAADEGTLISAAGVSCRSQIEDGTHRQVFHPIELVYQAIRSNQSADER